MWTGGSFGKRLRTSRVFGRRIDWLVLVCGSGRRGSDANTPAVQDGVVVSDSKGRIRADSGANLMLSASCLRGVARSTWYSVCK
jgi:hypothetical protein